MLDVACVCFGDLKARSRRPNLRDRRIICPRVPETRLVPFHLDNKAVNVFLRNPTIIPFPSTT